MSKLRIQRKTAGRSYDYRGQDLTDSVWYLLDEDGNTYEDQNEYEKAQEAKKPKPKPVAKKKAAVKKVEVKTED